MILAPPRPLWWPWDRRPLGAFLPEWFQHLKHRADGHLIRNAAGHLVHTCATRGCACSICLSGTMPCTLLLTVDGVSPCPGQPDPNGTYTLPYIGECVCGIVVPSGPLAGYTVLVAAGSLDSDPTHLGWSAIMHLGTSYLFQGTTSASATLDCSALPVVISNLGSVCDGEEPPFTGRITKATGGTATISTP